LPPLKNLFPCGRNIYPYYGESKGGEYGVPAKTKFLWGKNPPLYNELLFGGNIRGEFKRALALFYFSSPLSFSRRGGLRG
jgi:hypothetical protein